LTDAVDGILTGKRYLIHDRDPLFTIEFLSKPGGCWSEIRQATATIAESNRLRKK